MSRFRALFTGFRTAVAALIVCAMTTGGVILPAAAHAGAHSAKSIVDCQKARIAAQDAHSGAPAHEDGAGHCPDCCVSAGFVDLILPERVPTPVRTRAARGAVVFTHLVESDGRESLISGAGNGARAPPSTR